MTISSIIVPGAVTRVSFFSGKFDLLERSHHLLYSGFGFRNSDSCV